MDATKIKGYVLGFVAAATYGLNPLFALPLMGEGMDVPSILFYRYLLALPIVGLMMVARKKSLRVDRHQLRVLLVLGILMALSSVALFESYRFMDAGIASTILFVYPIMVAIIMGVVFHERISGVTIGCLLMAVLGICLLYKGSDGATLSLIGTLIVIMSALCYALYIVFVNHSCVVNVPTLTVSFYVLLFGLIPILGDIAMSGTMSHPAGFGQWGRILCLALLPTAISFLCTTMAIAYIGSTPTAILGAMEPVTAVVVGVTVFGEILTSRDVVGLVLIIVAVSLVIVGDRVGTALLRIRKLFPIHHHKNP